MGTNTVTPSAAYDFTDRLSLSVIVEGVLNKLHALIQCKHIQCHFELFSSSKDYFVLGYIGACIDNVLIAVGQ